jgi:hypothetical protein
MAEGPPMKQLTNGPLVWETLGQALHCRSFFDNFPWVLIVYHNISLNDEYGTFYYVIWFFSLQLSQ